MAQILCKMELDVAECAPGVMIMAKQGDFGSRFVQVRLMSHRVPLFVPEDAAVVLNVKRPDGEKRAFVGSVNGDGTLTLPLGGWMLAVEGVLLCDISVTDGAGAKLTSTCFSVYAEGAVCPDGELGSETESVTARFLSERQLFDLTPTITDGVAVFTPLTGRNYQLNLTDASLKGENGWLPVKIDLPSEVPTGEAGRILLRIFATRAGVGKYPEIRFGGTVIYRDDTSASLTQQNADILCTYAPKNGSWQIFFQNYGTAGTTPIRLELGELSTNAYRGDRGAAAYAHAMDTTGNPHGITPARIGATTAADVEEMLNAVTPAKIGAATPAYVDSKVAAAKVNVTQATGTSTTAVMSQKAVSDALNAITPAKIGAATPSYVDSKVANAGLGVDVKQTTGTSTTAVMSQKAVSDALAGITAALGVAESALAEV